MKIISILCFLAFNSCYAAENTYQRYTNDALGISFEYPDRAEVEDLSQNGKIRIWFHIGEWPKNLKYSGEQRPRSPVAGVLFSFEGVGDFKEHIDKERAGQVRGGYRGEITEKQYSIGEGLVGILFVRDAKQMKKVMHHFIFPTLKQNMVLSFWHLQDTETGFMMYPEEEAKAVSEYQRMIKTLQVFK